MSPSELMGSLQQGPWEGTGTWFWGGLMSFAEAILGLGAVLPGEASVLALAAVTATGQLPLLAAAVATGAVAGDHLNYLLGRVLGVRLSDSRLVARMGRRHWDRGVDLMQRHGAASLVISRMVPVVRTLMPAVAGAAHLRYRTFLVASVIGSMVWTLLWIGAGAAVIGVGTRAPAVIVVGVLVVVAVWVVSRSRGGEGLA